MGDQPISLTLTLPPCTLSVAWIGPAGDPCAPPAGEGAAVVPRLVGTFLEVPGLLGRHPLYFAISNSLTTCTCNLQPAPVLRPWRIRRSSILILLLLLLLCLFLFLFLFLSLAGYYYVYDSPSAGLDWTGLG